MMERHGGKKLYIKVLESANDNGRGTYNNTNGHYGSSRSRNRVGKLRKKRKAPTSPSYMGMMIMVLISMVLVTTLCVPFVAFLLLGKENVPHPHDNRAAAGGQTETHGKGGKSEGHFTGKQEGVKATTQQIRQKQQQAAAPAGDERAFVRRLLETAGVNVTTDMLPNIPLYSDITSMYYQIPKANPKTENPNDYTGKNHQVHIDGLDQCATFRTYIQDHKSENDPFDFYIAPAGMFNTGTNLMTLLLRDNCRLPPNTNNNDSTSSFPPSIKGQLRWQVPWGKHVPAQHRMRITYNDRGHDIGDDELTKVSGGAGVAKTKVLPIIMVKDPYTWMQSMCRNSYDAKWDRNKATYPTCPNLLAKEGPKGEEMIHVPHRGRRGADEPAMKKMTLEQRQRERQVHREKMLKARRIKEKEREQRRKQLQQQQLQQLHQAPHADDDTTGRRRRRRRLLEKPNSKLQTVPVRVIYRGAASKHSSLVGLWNDWYREWYNVETPRLIVRYEDVMFHPEETMEKICTCVGGEVTYETQIDYAGTRLGKGKDEEKNKKKKPRFQFYAGKVKTHGDKNQGMAVSILRYGNRTKRVEGFAKDDLEYAMEALDSELMEVLGYPPPVDVDGS